MKLEELYDMLRRAQEPKGFYFNEDKEKVLDLLAMLQKNKESYGYMGCPCRLVSGDRNWDQDIICPCVYREEDVKEYGSCYCGLYVSREWHEGQIPRAYVPERRPMEKTLGPDF